MLESKHVIGLFLLMLLFSGVFFTLGYVMGRNQYEGQARSAFGSGNRSEAVALPQTEPAPKKPVAPPAAADSDPATPSSNPEWEFYANSKPAKSEPHLEPATKVPAAAPPSKALNAKAKLPPQSAPTPVKNPSPATNPGLAASGTYVLQVAALLKQDDALAVANSLQKKHYVCFVQAPQKDKYYRVQVGPFKDRKSADAAKKGLEDEGFNAFYVKH